MAENIMKWREERMRELDILYDQGWLTDAEYNRKLDELYVAEGYRNEN